MSDYKFEGKIDDSGNIKGTISEKQTSGFDGPLSIFAVIIMYGLCITGGIIMISNVAVNAPFCIVPAVLAFIILLIPILSSIGGGNFVFKFFTSFFKWSDLLIGLFVAMFWISYIFETLSFAALMGLGLGLMYFTIVTVIKSIQKAGAWGGVISIAVPFAIYLIILACSSDFPVSYFAIIPTSSILISLLLGEIVKIYNFEFKHFNYDKALPITKIIIYLCIVASMFFVNHLSVQNKAMLIQTGKDYISENKFVEARKLLKDIKSEEAKELYESIRYKDVQVGEIIYNGYYKNSDERSVSENAVAFVCLEVVNNKALFISLDVIRLDENYNGVLDHQVYIDDFGFNITNIETTTIGDNQSKFFLLSKNQYNIFVQNDKLDDYLTKCNVSSYAQTQKKDIDNETWKWTFAYTDFWLLNDFTTQVFKDYIGSINCQTGEFEYQYNSKVYAGIRPCFYASTK